MASHMSVRATALGNGSPGRRSYLSCPFAMIPQWPDGRQRRLKPLESQVFELICFRVDYSSGVLRGWTQERMGTELDVHPDSIRRALRELRRQGLILTGWEGRDRVYAVVDPGPAGKPRKEEPSGATPGPSIDQGRSRKAVQNSAADRIAHRPPAAPSPDHDQPSTLTHRGPKSRESILSDVTHPQQFQEFTHASAEETGRSLNPNGDTGRTAPRKTGRTAPGVAHIARDPRGEIPENPREGTQRQRVPAPNLRPGRAAAAATRDGGEGARNGRGFEGSEGGAGQKIEIGEKNLHPPEGPSDPRIEAVRVLVREGFARSAEQLVEQAGAEVIAAAIAKADSGANQVRSRRGYIRALITSRDFRDEVWHDIDEQRRREERRADMAERRAAAAAQKRAEQEAAREVRSRRDALADAWLRSASPDQVEALLIEATGKGRVEIARRLRHQNDPNVAQWVHAMVGKHLDAHTVTIGGNR